KIVGTDIFHAAALLWVAGVGHLVAGNVDLHAMFWLLLGSVPGVLLTSQLTLRLPGQALRLGLATVLMLSGVKLVHPPVADWLRPPPVAPLLPRPFDQLVERRV